DVLRVTRGSNVDRDRAVESLLRAHPSRAAGDCLEPEVLAAWMDGGLSEREISIAEAHVADCSRCQALLATLAKSPQAAPAAAPPPSRDEAKEERARSDAAQGGVSGKLKKADDNARALSAAERGVAEPPKATSVDSQASAAAAPAAVATASPPPPPSASAAPSTADVDRATATLRSL